MAPPRKTIDELPEQGTAETTNYVIVQDSGVTKKMSVATLLGLASDPLTAHLANPPDAHIASAISATASGAGVDGPDVQVQLGQLAALVGTGGGGGGGGGDFVVSDTPPADTGVLWADTSDTAGVAVAQTVNVFSYTDESDLRPDATVVFWVPDPYTLGDPFGALPGDLVLRTTPDVVTGLNGVAGLWQGTTTEYDALETYDPSVVYFVVNP